ncbi:ethanolamine ammonia-lyase subunit EutC [Eubacterium aggregans]|uniref:ethanolamine ammonia-lyase subunit EutC n=1 Tax=Eubacterium aggregans TaxID=81409 RepID=UPI003F344383
MENSLHKEAYAKLKANAPCRLGIGKAGARYKTDPVLQFRAAHSAAQDAVFTDVDEDFVDGLGVFTVQTQCENKDVYLTRPDLGRCLSAEGAAMVRSHCVPNPQVQIFIADGLSSAAVEANGNEVLPAIIQGLEVNGIQIGTPFFVKYGRMAVMDEVSEITGADVTCVLIGERPGLITAQSMSAYMAYKATVGMPEARHNALSNIHRAGTNPAEAGAHIAAVLKKMLEEKKQRNRFKTIGGKRER